MLEAIERIEKYATRGEEAFRLDELIQTWMVQNIQVIGEVARALSQDLRNEYRDIPWTNIVGMRHVMVHEYFEIDPDIVWEVVSKDLPSLKTHIQAMLKDLGLPPIAQDPTGRVQLMQGGEGFEFVDIGPAANQLSTDAFAMTHVSYE